MKIIKANKAQDWERKITCEKCASQYIVEYNDVKYKENVGLFGISYFYVYCPICGGSSVIENLPYLNQKFAKENKK